MKSLDLSWVEKFSSLTLSEDDSTNVIERQGSEPFQSNLSEGWALHKPKGGAARFSEKVRQYLTSKFEIGDQGGLATAFDLAAFRLSMIAPVTKSVNHSRTVASMRETGWEQQQEVRLRRDSIV